MINPVAEKILTAIGRAGNRAWLVGGCVRDMFLKRVPKDWDVVTDLRPPEIKVLFPDHIAEWEDHGIINVKLDGEVIDVATLRADGDYSDGRRPDEVIFVDDPLYDSRRRDFTVNALYQDLHGNILDFHGGVHDLWWGELKCVGDPLVRFAEDALRMLRAYRFYTQLGLHPTEQTRRAIKACAEKIQNISGERIQSELMQIFAPPPERVGNVRGHIVLAFALRMMKEDGVLKQILPEVDRLEGCPQDPKWHPEGDVWTHTVKVVSILASEGEFTDTETILAGLLHDIGKKDCTQFEGERIRHIGHAEHGAKMALEICQRLKLTREQTTKIVDLVAQHMKAHGARDWNRSTMAKFLRGPYADSQILLQHADTCSTGLVENSLRTFYETAKVELRDAVYSEPLLRGKDLIDAGLTPSQKFTVILNAIREKQDAGEVTSKEQALSLALELANSSS